MLVSKKATQAGGAGGGESGIHEKIMSEELGENLKHFKGNLRG